MARNSKAQKAANASNPKPKCPVSDSNAKKTRSMDEIIGITTMDFQLKEKTEEDEINEMK